ncbi:Glycosyl-transferase family 4, partial [Sesbania bispinosa]
SWWAHDDKEEEFSGFGSRPNGTNSDFEQSPHHQELIAKNKYKSLSVNNETVENIKKVLIGDTEDVALAKKENIIPSQSKTSTKKRSRRPRGSLRGKRRRKLRVESSGNGIEEQEPEIPMRNSTYGFLVGPFGSEEDRILQWSHEKISGTCNRKGEFAHLVFSKRFVLIFHELSMTGAPLSMMELATELLSCGATVSAVVLSRKGGLMQELARRQIKVLDDKANRSFKTAVIADLVIAGSAVCASWIGMNRLGVLHRVKMLFFLSESQSKQWQKWCEEESIKLRSQPAIVPLSVNDELAFIAGIPSALDSQSFSAEKIDEKRKLLRDSVRREMGLTDNDMLVISLSSINPGKGQLLLLESANSIVEHGPLQDDKRMQKSPDVGEYLSNLARKHHIRKLLPLLKDRSRVALNNISSNSLNSIDLYFDVHRRRKVLSHNNGKMKQSLKILIGSVGSKSNKVDYVKGLLSFLAQHSNLSKSVLWTPATTRIASLYSAADVYVINSQVKRV